MDTSDVMYQKWYRKRQEYEELEETYRRQQRLYEEQHQDLQEHHYRLTCICHEEMDRMSDFIRRVNPRCAEPTNYFREMDELLIEADEIYRKCQYDIEVEEYEAEQTFRKQRWDYEEEIERLWRDYASTCE